MCKSISNSKLHKSKTLKKLYLTFIYYDWWCYFAETKSVFQTDYCTDRNGPDSKSLSWKPHHIPMLILFPPLQNWHHRTWHFFTLIWHKYTIYILGLFFHLHSFEIRWKQLKQDGGVMVESSDKTWSTGERNGKTLQYSCLQNPMNSMKRKNDRTLKDELPRSVGAQYATGNQWRNNFRKNEEMEPKQKQHPVVDVTGDRSKVRCY